MLTLSPQTRAILNNFTAFSENLLIQPGNDLCIYGNAGVLAKATVKEYFPVEIGIYNSPNFLSVIDLFKSPEFYFEDVYVRISEADGSAEATYLYAPPECISPLPPKSPPNISSEFITIDLSEETLTTLQSAASVLGRKEVCLRSDGRTTSVTTYNHENTNGHEYVIPVSKDAHGLQWNSVFAVANLRLLKGSYRATVTPSCTQFRNTSGYDLTYWIACDSVSTFG